MADIRRTSLLDDFLRDEDPILPPWYTMEGHQSPTMSSGGGGAFLPNDLFSVTSSAYLGNRVFIGPNVEAWAQQGEGPDITEAMSMGLLEIPFTTDTRRGYALTATDSIGGDGTGLDRWDDGSLTVLDSINFAQPANSIWLLRIVGDQVQGWFSTDAGANWTLLLEATDTTYRSFFYAWLRIGSDDAAGPTWLNIGGGVLNRQQEYRWFSGIRKPAVTA